MPSEYRLLCEDSELIEGKAFWVPMRRHPGLEQGDTSRAISLVREDRFNEACG